MARHHSGPLLCLSVMLLFAFSRGHAQTTSPARYYYAVEQIADGEVVVRGQTTKERIRAEDLILTPETRYRYWMYWVEGKLVGFAEFTTPAAGQRFTIPEVSLGKPQTPDLDADGLADEVERVIGTDPANPDTSGDGIKDGASIELGLDAGGARTGVIGSVDTPGTAVDVAAFNDIVAVADSSSGVSIFNVFNRMNPLIIGQVDTPGTAKAVAISGNLSQFS